LHLKIDEEPNLSWKILDDDALGKIKKQKEFEDQTAKNLTPLYESAKNPIIKLFIHSLILDTMRHSDTYQMLIDLNARALIGNESKAIGQKELASHIQEEAQMLKQTKDISEAVKDKKIKQLVLNILEDEKKHHRVLKDVLEILNKESKEWDAYLYELIEGFP
jgi:rubrerythrin